MTDTLASPRLDAVLWRLFAAAAKDGENDAPDRSSWARMTAAELAQTAVRVDSDAVRRTPDSARALTGGLTCPAPVWRLAAI
jgi:hypothetical protein